MSLYYSAEVYDSTMTCILQSSPSCSLMVKVVVLLVVNTSTSIESIALYFLSNNPFLSGSAIDLASLAWPQCNSIGGTKTPTQRNRYPETGCNGAPSLSIKTDFHVNFTETFSDGIRVFMNGNRRTLPHGTASSTIIDAWSRDTSNSF